jgi:hypothetical protein
MAHAAAQSPRSLPRSVSNDRAISMESSVMANSKPASQQGGSNAPAQQQGQQQGKPQGAGPQQQQGTTPVFKDWAAI